MEPRPALPPHKGDADGDRSVDGDDLVVWSAEYQNAQNAATNPNGPNFANGDALLEWQRGLNQPPNPPVAAAAATNSTPSSVALGATGGSAEASPELSRPGILAQLAPQTVDTQMQDRSSQRRLSQSAGYQRISSAFDTVAGSVAENRDDIADREPVQRTARQRVFDRFDFGDRARQSASLADDLEPLSEARSARVAAFERLAEVFDWS